MAEKVYIVAEMSANHCGDIDLAKDIIKAAKNSGADAIKIQTYTPDTLTLNCKKPCFMANADGLWSGKSLYQLYEKAYTPWDWQPILKQFAEEIGIDFFSTPFDYTAVDFLEKINVPAYKIASFEAIDFNLIKYTAKFGKPMYISCGISTLEEIQEAVDACKSVGNNNITLLKCTSSYPAKIEEMNIKTISDMVNRFGPQGVKVGLSDHSMSNIPAVLAVSLGITMLEKHFTLDRALGGEDSEFSLNPSEFSELVRTVREAERALGTVSYSVNEKNRHYARSLFFTKNLKKGDVLSDDNVKSIRPSNGLHPRYHDAIIGKKVKFDVESGTPVKWELLQD